MRFERSVIKDYLDRFLEEIKRNTEIPIEDIELVETKFKNSWLIMQTSKGKLIFDPRREYDPRDECLEAIILHELGHRAHHAINPDMDKLVIEGLIGFNLPDLSIAKKLYGVMKLILSGNLSVPLCMNEGIAECFGFDIFPEFCSVSDHGRDYIGNRKEKHNSAKNLDIMRVSRGYRFFHELYSSGGLDGMIAYIKDFSKNQVPSRKEMINPQKYWGKNLSSISLPTSH
jgi:hypothetical protein